MVDNLRVTHRFLADEHERMKDSNELVRKISGNMQQANSTYASYQSNIHKTTSLVDQIKNKEWWDHFKLQGSYYMFMASAAYLFCKRFYLEELCIYFLMYAFEFASLVVREVSRLLSGAGAGVANQIDWWELLRENDSQIDSFRVL